MKVTKIKTTKCHCKSRCELAQHYKCYRKVSDCSIAKVFRAIDRKMNFR